MIVDTSALLAIALEEPEAAAFADAILAASDPMLCAATWLEATIVAQGRGRVAGIARLQAVLAALPLRLVPFTVEAAMEAAQAVGRYGKGTGSGAQLNFGDCISYGAAKAAQQTLLFKGNDFPRTDITPAL